MAAKELRQRFQQTLAGLLQQSPVTVFPSEIQLIAQPSFAKELDPITRASVELRCKPDGVVAVPAKLYSGEAMLLGELAPKPCFCGRTAPLRFDPFQRKIRVLLSRPVRQNARHANCRRFRKLLQSFGFCLKHREAFTRCNLDEYWTCIRLPLIRLVDVATVDRPCGREVHTRTQCGTEMFCDF